MTYKEVTQLINKKLTIYSRTQEIMGLKFLSDREFKDVKKVLNKNKYKKYLRQFIKDVNPNKPVDYIVEFVVGTQLIDKIPTLRNFVHKHYF